MGLDVVGPWHVEIGGVRMRYVFRGYEVRHCDDCARDTEHRVTDVFAGEACVGTVVRCWECPIDHG